VNIEIDQNCNLKELYETAKNTNLDNQKCPLSFYVLINLRRMFILCLFCCMFILLITNIF